MFIATAGGVTADQWDAVRNWLGTVGGVIALIIAALTYRRNAQLRDEDQARRVYAWIESRRDVGPGEEVEALPGGALVGAPTPEGSIIIAKEPGIASLLVSHPTIQVVVKIHNGSDELIGPIKVQVVNIGMKKTWDVSIALASIEPESDYLVAFTWTNDVAPGSPSVGPTVIFQDARGQWWRRHLAQPIERVHDDPENTAPTPRERAQIRENAVALGLVASSEPPQELPISMRVRVHRARRRLRGKSPIP